MKRKLFLITVVIIILSSIGINAYATGDNIFYYGEDSVIFPSASNLSYAQKEKIAHTIMIENENIITPYGWFIMHFVRS